MTQLGYLNIKSTAWEAMGAFDIVCLEKGDINHGVPILVISFYLSSYLFKH